MSPASPHVLSLKRSLSVSDSVDYAPADLLLPEYLYQYAKSLKKRRGEWRDLIEYLIRRHSQTVFLLAARSGNLRFRYQEEGLHLQRICYLPYVNTRAELRMLSYASRISMCALIVLMLLWEREAEGKSRKTLVVPMNFVSKWVLKGFLLSISARIRAQGRPHPS